MNGSDLENNISVIVPSYLYESSGPLLSDNELLSSTIEKEFAEYRNIVSSNSNDYTVILSGIESGVYDISSSTSATMVELTMMNNRLNRLEDSLYTIVCFLVVFTILAIIKICFAIFNKILGLGQA